MTMGIMPVTGIPLPLLSYGGSAALVFFAGGGAGPKSGKDVIRKRAALKARGHAMTAEARTSSSILALLPVLTGGMLYALNPQYMMLLFTDPTGKTFFSIAIISLIMGMLAIRAIIKSVLP